jgi:predicted nucleic acid-binding protein
LIGLARIERLDLLDALAKEVLVPEAVVAELRRGPSEDPSTAALERLACARIIAIETIDPAVEAWGLGRGESEVLTLARLSDAAAVLDDRDARRCATALSVRRIGTLGLLVIAKRAGYVEFIKPLIEGLLKSRIRLSGDLVRRALIEAGED